MLESTEPAEPAYPAEPAEEEEEEAEESVLTVYDPRQLTTPEARAHLLRLGWKTMNVRALARPRDSAELRMRLARNLPQYAPVYGACTGGLLLVSALCSPLLLASWLVVAAAWGAYVWGVPSTTSVVAGRTLTPIEKRIALLATNLVVFVWGGLLNSVAWVLLVGFVGGTTHAAARRLEARLEDEDEVTV